MSRFSISAIKEPTCFKVSISQLFHKQLSKVCVSSLTIIDRTHYLASTPENFSPSCWVKPTFRQLTALPVPGLPSFHGGGRCKGEKNPPLFLKSRLGRFRAGSSRSPPLLVAPAGWLGLNVDSGGRCCLLLVLASNREHPTGAGRPPHFKIF